MNTITKTLLSNYLTRQMMLPLLWKWNVSPKGSLGLRTLLVGFRIWMSLKLAMWFWIVMRCWNLLIRILWKLGKVGLWMLWRIGVMRFVWLWKGCRISGMFLLCFGRRMRLGFNRYTLCLVIAPKGATLFEVTLIVSICCQDSVFNWINFTQRAFMFGDI